MPLPDVCVLHADMFITVMCHPDLLDVRDAAGMTWAADRRAGQWGLSRLKATADSDPRSPPPSIRAALQSEQQGKGGDGEAIEEEPMVPILR